MQSLTGERARGGGGNAGAQTTWTLIVGALNEWALIAPGMDLFRGPVGFLLYTNPKNFLNFSIISTVSYYPSLT